MGRIVWTDIPLKRSNAKLARDHWRWRIVSILVCCFVGLSTSIAANNKNSAANLRAFARVYMVNGDYLKAQSLVEKALEKARTNPSNDSEISLCFLDLAYLLNGYGSFVEAERNCRQGLVLQEIVHGDQHPYVAYTLRILSTAQQGQGKYVAAREAIDKAIGIMEELGAAEDQAIAPFLVDLSKLLVEQGQLAEAEKYYMRALPLINGSYGPEHLYTANVYGDIARLYALQGRFGKAEEFVNKALAKQADVYGGDHSNLADTWITMALICRGRNNHEDTRTLAEKAISSLESKVLPEHPTVKEAISILAELPARGEKYASRQK